MTIKSQDQQALVALHRVRVQWIQSRTARINGMRALLREFGVVVPLGSKRFLNDLHRLVGEKHDHLPDRVRRTVHALWDEVRELEQRIDTPGDELEAIAIQEPVIQALLQIPGLGVITATAMFATVGDIHAFRNGRQLACWLGLTPREFSSGSRRRLGRISKQGDPYVRMLLIHGARAALNAARRAAQADKPLTQLQAWALKRAHNPHSNKAAVAVPWELPWRMQRSTEGEGRNPLHLTVALQN